MYGSTNAFLSTARTLFAERGFAGVATEELLDRAGITQEALDREFPGGKEELFEAVLLETIAQAAQRVARAARAEQDPWLALLAGVDAFLDACATPEVRRIVVRDGPSVLGSDFWQAIDAEYGLGVIERALARVAEPGRLLPQPTPALAQVVLGELREAAMVLASAEDPEVARVEMGRAVHRLLDSLRAAGA